MIRATRAAAVAVLAAASGAAFAAQPQDELDVTRRLAEAGATQLALDRVARLQPRERTAPHWYEWEALRCGALGALDRHALLLERVAAIPPDARAEPLVACSIHAARAAMAMERYADARRHAARALWQFRVGPVDVQAMRRLVIDAYAGEGRGDEAYRAILRYQQDHHPVPRDVLGRFVHALLDLGMDKEALNSLSQLDDTEPAKLRLRLRAGLVPRDTAVTQARGALAKGGHSAYWRVMLDAASDIDGSPLRVTAYEQLLNGRNDVTLETPAAASRLWHAYLATAAQAANAARLLVGDDASWADYAGRRLGSEPAVARALFAHLAQRSHTAAARHNAQLQLLHAYQEERLEGVALRVFGALLGDVDALDTQVRYRLGDMAESRGEPAAATRYWQDLPPPASMDAGEWLVRVSRQRWRAGGEDTGAEAITRHYAAQRHLALAAVQQGTAYAEELAERGQPKSALRLLEALVPNAQPAQQRALLMTLGRARDAAGEFVLAAEAYLGFALAASGVSDASAVQARLRAGTALARAGYARDARMQFVWIIDNVKDTAIVEAARSELAKLQL